MTKTDLDLYLKMIDKKKLEYQLHETQNLALLEKMALTAIEQYHSQFIERK